MISSSWWLTFKFQSDFKIIFLQIEDDVLSTSPADETFAQTINSINDKLVFVASEKSLRSNRKTAIENILPDPPSSIQHKTDCSRPRDRNSCRMQCDIICKDCAGEVISSSQVDDPFANDHFKEEEAACLKSKFVVQREFSSSKVSMEAFPMHVKRRTKRRIHCFPSDKGLRWTRNVSNYLRSTPTNELVRRYLPRDSVVVRVGFKPRISLRLCSSYDA